MFTNCPPLDAVILSQMVIMKTNVCPKCAAALKVGDRYSKITRHNGKTGNYHKTCYDKMYY